MKMIKLQWTYSVTVSIIILTLAGCAASAPKVGNPQYQKAVENLGITPGEGYSVKMVWYPNRLISKYDDWAGQEECTFIATNDKIVIALYDKGARSFRKAFEVTYADITKILIADFGAGVYDMHVFHIHVGSTAHSVSFAGKSNMIKFIEKQIRLSGNSRALSYASNELLPTKK